MIRAGWEGKQSHTGDCCILSHRVENSIARVWFKNSLDDLKQIYRFGINFYWTDSPC